MCLALNNLVISVLGVNPWPIAIVSEKIFLYLPVFKFNIFTFIPPSTSTAFSILQLECTGILFRKILKIHFIPSLKFFRFVIKDNVDLIQSNLLLVSTIASTLPPNLDM